ncbi:unnamed protein product [Clonostachys solani]|uniref:Uncharacterized protein n=1 Tax=Clonostachys solani TaxID=160281 RepID=A0A9N9Z270_9HYPO|nr:unnamed protein product [Clonostachys solani]
MAMLPQGIYARKLFDITWADVFRGVYYSLASGFSSAHDQEEAIENLEELWAPTQTLVTLSVRSAFDLFLQACEFPPGSEILISAVTIPHMVSIIRLHGLVPVPIDLQPDATVSVEDVLPLIRPQTTAILVAHLFGQRQSLAALGELAQHHNLMLIEDCAQAFCGLDFKGSPEASVSMFSFGPIKTCTSLAGGIVTVRVPQLLDAMRGIQSGYPNYRDTDYLKRILKYAAMKAVVSSPLFYGGLISILQRRGINHHQFITRASHSLASGDFLQQIRLSPSPGLVRLLNHRLSHFDATALERRASRIADIADMLPATMQPIGYNASLRGKPTNCHYWLCPIRVQNPDVVLGDLLCAGFDAAAGNATLIVVPGQEHPSAKGDDDEGSVSEASKAKSMMENVIYLPIDNNFDQIATKRLINTLANVESGIKKA